MGDTGGVSSDAGTAALVALRGRAQTLHEAVAAATGGDVPAGVAGSGLREAAERTAALLRSWDGLLDPERTAPVADRLDPREHGDGRGSGPAAAAAAVREAAALDDLCADLLADVPRALVLGPVGDRLRQELRARRDEAADELAAHLADEACAATLRAVDGLVITPPLTDAAAGKASKALARAAGDDDRRLDEAVAVLREAAGPQEHEHRRVAVRSAALALATSAAAAADEHGKKARRLAEAADAVVAAVDALDDTARASRLLVDLADRAHRRREPGFTYGLLHAAATARSRRARVALDDALEEVADEKRRSWLPGR